MALDLKKYYERIRAVAEQLPESEIDLISVENPDRAVMAGTVTRASRMFAARLIVDRTHRVATAAEVTQAHSGMEARLATYGEKDKKRAPMEVIADRLSRIVESQAASSESSKAKRSA